jgi:hypothetical protein
MRSGYAQVHQRNAFEQRSAIAHDEVHRVIGHHDDRTRRSHGVLLAQVRGHRALVRIAAERGLVEKFGEDLYRPGLRARHRLAQAAISRDVSRRQPAVGMEDEHVPRFLCHR